MAFLILFALLIFTQSGFSATPLICPSGMPVGSVDLRVVSARWGTEALPLRTINKLEEGDVLRYRPIVRQNENRRGEVALVIVPANQAAVGEKLRILEPKPANKPQQWSVPWRVSVVAFVYGPSGLNTSKVEKFLSQDDEFVGQLADYAEKTEKTEALIAELSSNDTSAASFHSALQGFSSQYGINGQISKTAPMDQQAMALFQGINPALATYDPVSPQATQSAGQTARLATSVGELFFGSPVGLAAGGTALLLELRAIAFPNSQFRSSFAQPLPDDGLGLCAKPGVPPPHTKIAYLWASRVPNLGPPQLSIGKANFLPAGVKSPLPLAASDGEPKPVDRAREWVLLPERGNPIPVKVKPLAETKSLELDLNPNLSPGKYRLAARWDWDSFELNDSLQVLPLSDFSVAGLVPASQDRLIAHKGKVAVTVEGSDFEFISKVELEKLNDEFAMPVSVPFVLPHGLRQGPQQQMNIQLDTGGLDPGQYKLNLWQTDGKQHAVNLKVLSDPPTIENLPLVLGQNSVQVEFRLKGQRLNQLRRLEVANGTVDLGPARPDQTERDCTFRIDASVNAGTNLAIKAFAEDRSEPLILFDAVRIVGARPTITEVTISKPQAQQVQLEPGELPGGVFLSAMMRAERLYPNSVVKLGCRPSSGIALTNEAPLVSRLGEHAGAFNARQLTADKIFLSFDTSLFLNHCLLQATIGSGTEGESEPYQMGRIIVAPSVEKFELTGEISSDGFSRAILHGQNLETIEKTGGSTDQAELVTELPLPEGNGQRQTLQIRTAISKDPLGPFYVWLRGESTPRIVSIRPIGPASPKPVAPVQ